MIPFLHIVCYKWGSRYSSNEVNILYSMVSRNLAIPFKFHCITDDGSGLSDQISAHPLPVGLPGNGPKIFTFSEGFLGLGPKDYAVCLDVDLVIVDNLDFLGERPEADFIVAKHRLRKGEQRIHGAVYRVRVGSMRHIWDEFIQNPEACALMFPGFKGNRFSEQFWLEHQIPEAQRVFFDKEKVILYRHDCNSLAVRGRWEKLAKKLGFKMSRTAIAGKAKLPGIGEAIVSFAGQTKPRHVRDTYHNQHRHAPFVKKYWVL